MSSSYSQRERRNIISAWLNDRFGHTMEVREPRRDGEPGVPDAAFWKDAHDLVRFLKANGFKIEVPDWDNYDDDEDDEDDDDDDDPPCGRESCLHNCAECVEYYDGIKDDDESS